MSHAMPRLPRGDGGRASVLPIRLIEDLLEGVVASSHERAEQAAISIAQQAPSVQASPEHARRPPEVPITEVGQPCPDFYDWARGQSQACPRGAGDGEAVDVPPNHIPNGAPVASDNAPEHPMFRPHVPGPVGSDPILAIAWNVVQPDVHGCQRTRTAGQGPDMPGCGRR